MSTENRPAPRELPTSGPGSPASWPRRFAALLIDWALANIIAFALSGGGRVWDPQDGAAWMPLVCWFLLVWPATAFTGASPGQWLLNVRVICLHGQRIGVVGAAIRTALILLVIPPLIFTSEGRGLHDLAADSAAVDGPARR